QNRKRARLYGQHPRHTRHSWRTFDDPLINESLDARNPQENHSLVRTGCELHPNHLATFGNLRKSCRIPSNTIKPALNGSTLIDPSGCRVTCLVKMSAWPSKTARQMTWRS